MTDDFRLTGEHGSSDGRDCLGRDPQCQTLRDRHHLQLTRQVRNGLPTPFLDVAEYALPSPLVAGLSHVADEVEEEVFVPSGAKQFSAQRSLGVGMSSSDIE